MNECSIDHWMDSDKMVNSSQAHKLFYENVLPHYIGKHSNKLGLLKSLQQSQIRSNTRSHLIESQGLCQGVAELKNLVQKLDENKH